MARCDFANARLGAVRSRLLGARGVRALLARPDFAARMELLRHTEYAPAVPPAGLAAREAIPALERELREFAAREVENIEEQLEGHRQKELFAGVRSLEDGWALKTLLRAAAAGHAGDVAVAQLRPTPGLSWTALRQLAARGGVAPLVEALEDVAPRFAPALKEALPSFADHGLLPLEVGVDRVAYGQALAACKGHGEDERLVRRHLELQIDLVNAATLLKIDSSAIADQLFLPGGMSLPHDRFLCDAELDAEGRRAAVAGWLRDQFRVTAADALGDPARADQLLREISLRQLRREARMQPLSLAVPLALVAGRAEELRRLRLALRGAEFGLSGEDLVAFLED